jgi:hypothetical protein
MRGARPPTSHRQHQDELAAARLDGRAQLEVRAEAADAIFQPRCRGRPGGPPSALVGQRATTTRPPLRRKPSTDSMIGAASTTNRCAGHGATAVIAPFFVLHERCARRSWTSPFAPLDEDFDLADFEGFVVNPSTLGPRGSLTDICGSTGSSHSQHRQPSRSPISSTRLIGARP